MSSRRANLRVVAIPAILIVLLPVAALAHSGHDQVGRNAFFLAGLVHPLSGIDHLFALLLAGGLSASRGRSQLPLLLSVLLIAMIISLFSDLGLGRPLSDTLNTLSVVALTAAVLLRLRTSIAFTISALALFGLGHGLAHGIESSLTSSTFVFGMLVTSALLLAAGGTADLMLSRYFQAAAMRVHGPPSTRTRESSALPSGECATHRIGQQRGPKAGDTG